MHFTTRIACSLFLVLPVPLVAQRIRTDTAALQRLLVTEDSRGTRSGGAAPLVEALASPDTLLRRVAIRGLGRLQRPELGASLLPALRDPSPAIRAEAANALAQSLRRATRGTANADSSQSTPADAQVALTEALAREKNPRTAGIIARSLGRLVLADSAAARAAEEAIVQKGQRQPSYDLLHGLYRIALARPVTGAPSADAIALLRKSARSAPDAPTRRLALLALRAAAAFDSTTVLSGSRHRDPQVRRLSLAGVASLSDAARAGVLRRAFSDPSPIVRIEAIAASRIGTPRPDCTPIIAATNDAVLHVRQMAIDALGSVCADSGAAILALTSVMDGGPIAGEPSSHQWQLRAHALLALAKRDPATARRYMASVAGSANALERTYAARAAGAMNDTAQLVRMSADNDHNVTETAITELARVAKRAADTVFVRGLASRGYQVVLAAAQALSGSRHERALPGLLQSFDRISQAKSENARDPRVAMLKRIEEVGTKENATRLRPYLADFDTTVAQTVAGMINKWTGENVVASPQPLPITWEPLARIFIAQNLRLRVTMAPSSGGGSFTLRLFSSDAPATVARYVRLADAHYFDGHVLQRVEPNFVIQGGGPDASEYVGEDQFMRDEVHFRPHFRGTAGVSSRGRDTGDAQLFLNLADNPVLDHEYTVFGEVVQGLEVMDRIMEGDVIARVEVLRGR